MSWPAVLSASASLAAGALKGFDAERLQNTFDSVMAIDEVRFVTRSDDLAGGNFQAGGADFAGTVGVKMAMNGLEMMSKYVPICLLAPVDDVDVQTWFGGPVSPYTVTISQYVWRLRRPLLVPVGGVLDVQAFRAQDGITGSAALDIAFAGRVMPEGFQMPPAIDVPYVDSYVSAFDRGTAGVSGERDLFNRLEKTVKIFGFINAGPTIFPDADLGGSTVGLTGSTMKISMNPENVSSSKVLIAASSIFDSNRMWSIKAELPSKSRFIAEWTAAAVPISGSEPIQLSFLGYREEAVR